MNDKYDEICSKLNTITWLMRKQSFQTNMRGNPFFAGDTTKGQGRILAMLKIRPEIKTKDLSYLLGIRQQSLNEQLKKLEKRGYIVRRPSDEDKRVMIVCLTEKGKQVEQEDTAEWDFLSCLNDEELEQFEEYLDRIIEALNQTVWTDNEREEMEAWFMSKREHLNPEEFRKMMSMRRGGFNPFERGKAPENMPGAERFSPDYDGPIPDRGEPFPWMNKD